MYADPINYIHGIWGRHYGENDDVHSTYCCSFLAMNLLFLFFSNFEFFEFVVYESISFGKARENNKRQLQQVPEISP